MGRGNKSKKQKAKSPQKESSGSSGNSGSSQSVLTPKVKKKPDVAQLPSDLKVLRSCMICSLIKTASEFEESGCDNCESVLQLAGTGSVHSYTSENFEGMIGALEMKTSWVAKWQRIENLKPGCYAVNVRGEPSQAVKEELEDAGSPYVSRDRSKSSQ